MPVPINAVFVLISGWYVILRVLARMEEEFVDLYQASPGLLALAKLVGHETQVTMSEWVALERDITKSEEANELANAMKVRLEGVLAYINHVGAGLDITGKATGLIINFLLAAWKEEDLMEGGRAYMLFMRNAPERGKKTSGAKLVRKEDLVQFFNTAKQIKLAMRVNHEPVEKSGAEWLREIAQQVGAPDGNMLSVILAAAQAGSLTVVSLGDTIDTLRKEGANPNRLSPGVREAARRMVPAALALA